MNRRAFLAGSGASLFLAATHGPQTWASPETGPLESRASPATHRLLSLDLVTAAPLEEMEEFYGDLLGLATERGDDRLTILGGATRITFSKAGAGYLKPFYHFAFNIPENKLLAARNWQLDRTPLIPPWENLRDPTFPDDVVHFRSWDAHSVFFWDPAGNCVEYIARHTLHNGTPGPFTTGDILYASEIAFVTDDVDATALILRETLAVDQYQGGSDNFRALGDEHGLLLLMKRGRIMGFETGHPIDVAPVHAKIRGGPKPAYGVESYPYLISG